MDNLAATADVWTGAAATVIAAAPTAIAAAQTTGIRCCHWRESLEIWQHQPTLQHRIKHCRDRSSTSHSMLAPVGRQHMQQYRDNSRHCSTFNRTLAPPQQQQKQQSQPSNSRRCSRHHSLSNSAHCSSNITLATAQTQLRAYIWSESCILTTTHMQ